MSTLCVEFKRSMTQLDYQIDYQIRVWFNFRGF